MLLVRTLWMPAASMMARTRGPAMTPVPSLAGRRNRKPAGMTFEICDSPADLEMQLRRKREEGSSVRLLSSYSRKWITRDAARPHDLPPELMDFHLPYLRGGVRMHWSRIWNYVPDNDYTLFVQCREGSPMHEDPLCEIGCPYAVRGFDFDYVGVLWMEDLVWRDDKWLADPDANFETGIDRTIRNARNEPDAEGPMQRKLLIAVLQSYRILLTRAMKGIYLYVEDDETREHLVASLTGPVNTSCQGSDW